jgi:alcohol dehydrogenase class IV
MKFPDFCLFNVPTRIVFGPGLSADFSAELVGLGGSRAMIVTEKFLSGLGLPSRIRGALEGAGLELAGCFDEVVPDSAVELVERGAQVARELRADRIVALGGGSSIDTAKAINLLLSEGGKLLDHQGVQTLTRPLLPLIAIPTTAGTGSEVSTAAVIHDPATRTKVSFVDRHLAPALAVLDPELTLTLPARMTAATGMDALTHAIEAFTGLEASPFSDALAAQAVQLVFRHLETAVSQPSELEARSGMLVASTMAGIAFSHSMVGVVHAMAHALGGHCRVPHGEANAVMLPHGIDFNLATRQEKYAQLGGWLGCEPEGMPPTLAAATASAGVRRLLASLHERCGSPTNLTQAGVRAEELPEVAALAICEGSTFYNPREVTEEHVLRMLRSALGA